MSIFSGEFTAQTIRKNVTVRVIFPDSPFDLEQIETQPKTMYLLHGYGGSSADWPRFTRIEYLARLYNFVIVMADASNSFYQDMVYGGNYLKFFGEELPEEINKRFKLPEKTFICGQSMGGYGCIRIGLEYPDQFKAIGCLSGGVGFFEETASNNRLENKDLIAAVGQDQKGTDISLRGLTKKAMDRGKVLPIFMYCGTEDFLFEDNNAFDEYLTAIHYPHSYKTSSGRHMWDYWDRVMPSLMEDLCHMK